MKHEEISLHTKRKLADSLKKKMKKKPFQKITVSELVEETNINRKTFYYHFEDIYSLLKWMLEEEAINIIRHFDLLHQPEEAINFVMDYIEENDHIINCAYNSIGRDGLQQFFMSDFQDIVASIINTEEENRKIKLDPAFKEFIIQFYLNAISGALIDWIKDKNHRNRERMTDYLTKTMKYFIDCIFNSNDPSFIDLNRNSNL